MRPIQVSVGPVGTVSATNIATSQTPGAAGSLTLNGSLVSGGIATLPTPQRVLITTTDTTTVFTIVGTTSTGAFLTETVTNAGTSAYSTLDYATVTAIKVNQGTTAAVTVGTNGIASTPWVRLDEWANSYVTVQVDVTGTVNYTVQGTMDDPNQAWGSAPLPQSVNWINSGDTNAVGQTASIATNFLFAPTYVRVLLNSGSGSIQARFAQADVVSR